jgi:hypothetical protein
MLPTGEYGAYRDNEDDGRVQGTGHTRLAAIADMVENLSGFDARFIYDENEIDAEGEE